MSTAYDPMLPGFENWVNTPYQYWKSNAPDAKDGIVELVINGKKFTSKIDANGDWEFQLPLQLAEGGHNLSIRYVDLAGNYGDVY